MKYCPIIYDEISNNTYYSAKGLRLLSAQLKKLNVIALSAKQQREEALLRAGKMSIQGVQPKFSAKLKIKEGNFEIVNAGGRFILKPQSESYEELPENEAITMTLASMIGIEVPVHGLVYSIDKSFTYFVKRFDREPKSKLAVEDFAQLLSLSRDTKYDSSMEKVAEVIATYCAFPRLEFIKLFRLVLFNYLVGNEDMHLKNFSLITRNKVVQLSPAYDLLNTSIVLPQAREELALPLNGKKSNLTKKDFLIYYAQNRLQLSPAVINKVLEDIKSALPKWKDYISISYLSNNFKEKYLKLLAKRSDIIFY